MPTPTFELIDAYEWIRTRNFVPADKTPLDGFNANPYVMGEFMELDSSYKMARGAGEAAVPSWPIFSETGRYDTQATARGLMPILWLLPFEAHTLICDTAVGAGISLGSPLTIDDVTYGGLTKRGLRAANAGLVVGYCTRVIGTNEINFIRTLT